MEECPDCKAITRGQTFAWICRHVAKHGLQYRLFCPVCEKGPDKATGLDKHQWTAHGCILPYKRWHLSKKSTKSTTTPQKTNGGELVDRLWREMKTPEVLSPLSVEDEDDEVDHPSGSVAVSPTVSTPVEDQGPGPVPQGQSPRASPRGEQVLLPLDPTQEEPSDTEAPPEQPQTSGAESRTPPSSSPASRSDVSVSSIIVQKVDASTNTDLRFFIDRECQTFKENKRSVGTQKSMKKAKIIRNPDGEVIVKIPEVDFE